MVQNHTSRDLATSNEICYHSNLILDRMNYCFFVDFLLPVINFDDFFIFYKKCQKILEIGKVRAGYVASGGPAPPKNDPKMTKRAQKY